MYDGDGSQHSTTNDQAPRPSLAKPNIPATQSIAPASYSQVLAQFAELSGLVISSILHPIDAFRTHAPYINPFNMFGGPTFTPKNIPNLAGKVVLVTGGTNLPFTSVCCQLANLIFRKCWSGQRNHSSTCQAQSFSNISRRPHRIQSQGCHLIYQISAVLTRRHSIPSPRSCLLQFNSCRREDFHLAIFAT